MIEQTTKEGERPLVSIIIPNFNRADLIGETLGSVQAQTYDHWEAIVVDDHSTDDSEAVVQKMAALDERIRWIKRNREPKGGPTCRNIGVQEAKGSYVIFLDSDDLLAPFCLKQRLDYMQSHRELSFAVFIGQLFHKKPGDNQKLINIPTNEKDIFRFLKQDTPWLISNPIWKADVVKHLHWNEQISCFQDYFFHIQALLKEISYKYVTNEPDCFWRRGSYTAVSGSNNNRQGVISVKIIIDFVFLHAKQEKRLSEYEPYLQRAYIDVINRALNAQDRKLAFEILSDHNFAEVLSLVQKKLLLTYIKCFPVDGSDFKKRLVKKIYRNLIGQNIFQMQYNHFTRVEKNTFFSKINLKVESPVK